MEEACVGTTPRRFAVSFVIPARDEERHLKAAVDSVLAQVNIEDSDIIIVLARSSDRTAEIAEQLAAEHRAVRIVDNPTGTISRGINHGVTLARHDVVIRVDAHSVIPPDYAHLAASILDESGAANVGGIMRAVGTTPFEVAVAWAYNSGAGVGQAVYHVGGAAGPADSAYLGTFHRERFLLAGGFDDTLGRGEDWELNFRLRSLGYTVWFDPRLVVVYRPRSSPRALMRQFLASGRWRGSLVRRTPRGTPARYLAPPLLLLGMALGIISAIAAWFAAPPAAIVLAVAAVAPFALYAAWLAWTVMRAHGDPRPSRRRLLAVLVVMHTSWGIGFLMSFVTRNPAAHSYSGR
jgi:succinoglycan biosynthesis protein ExoA